MNLGRISTFVCLFNLVTSLLLVILYSRFLGAGHCQKYSHGVRVPDCNPPIWYAIGALFTALGAINDFILILTSGMTMFQTCFGAGSMETEIDEDVQQRVIHYYMAYTGLDFLFRVIQTVCLVILFWAGYAKDEFGETIWNEIFIFILILMVLKLIYHLIFSIVFCCWECQSSDDDEKESINKTPCA